MTNTQTVRIDLTSPGGFAPVIHAVAGDIYSRFVRMELYQGGVLYEPPSGTTCVIGWRRGETYGAYSSILEEDGSSSHPAWELEDNVLTIELDWHVCQHPGDVAVNVSLNGEGGSRLHTWELCCRVARGAVADADDPTKPSESATDAANRAEVAAAEAKDSAADLEDAVKRAEAAAQRAEAAAPVEGTVTSVNGKGGAVVLDAYDVGAPRHHRGRPGRDAAGRQGGHLRRQDHHRDRAATQRRRFCGDHREHPGGTAQSGRALWPCGDGFERRDRTRYL